MQRDKTIVKKHNSTDFRNKRLVLGKYAARGFCLFLSLSLMGGCSSNTVPEKEQRNLTPYSLYGRNDDWEIRCTVRELTADEKKEKWREWERDWEAEEELLLSQEVNPKTYEQVKAQHELIRQELTEKKAYISTITGICHNGGMDGQILDFQLTDGKNNKVIAGTQVVSFSEARQWYSSWQTETHTEHGMLIPPLENAKMILHIGDEEIAIPLERAIHTEQIIE